MTKHIGIVACTSEGAALCYRTICLEGEKYTGKAFSHPEVTMHSFPMDLWFKYGDHKNWNHEEIIRLMTSSAEKLSKAGSDFAICPDNTVHIDFDAVEKRSPIPWLHIAEEIAKVAKERGFKKLGLLGTRPLVESNVYPARLAKYEIEHEIPDENDRQMIFDIIINELVKGKFTADARSKFRTVIDKLKKKGCDAVVLGCTEIPLLINDECSSLPTLDSTRTLARAAIQHALKN